MTNKSISSELFVEGIDDKHSIIHLLKGNGISFDPTPPVEVTIAENDEAVLDRIPTVIKAGAGRNIGFIIDIDQTPQNRWEQIRGQLQDPLLTHLSQSIDRKFPASPKPEGTIIHIQEINARVGFWLMPDNQLEMGKLEHLLDTLIADGDPLRAFAEKSTGESVSYGAKFPKKDQIKAMLHTWLAWQEKPGLPYGTAINAKYFATHSPAAQLFVTWCKTLFSLQ